MEWRRTGIDLLLLSFNLTRPQRISERNNATYPTSRSPAENTPYLRDFDIRDGQFDANQQSRMNILSGD